MDRASKLGKAQGALEEINHMLADEIFASMDPAPHAAEQDLAAKTIVARRAETCFKTCPKSYATCVDKRRSMPIGNLLPDKENAIAAHLVMVCPVTDPLAEAA